MLLFLAGMGAALMVLGAWWIISRLMDTLHVLQDHERRLQAAELGVEDASAGVDQLTDDLADLSRRALALDPQYVLGEEAAGEDTAD